MRGPHPAVEGQLAEQGDVAQPLGLELAGRRKDRAGDRKVKPGTRLGQIPGGEVGGYPPGGELESAVSDRRLDALPCLTYGCVGQPDDRERGQTGPDVELDQHVPRQRALDRERVRLGKHGPEKLGRACDGTLWPTGCPGRPSE